jgi:hypothetical protein
MRPLAVRSGPAPVDKEPLSAHAPLRRVATLIPVWSPGPVPDLTIDTQEDACPIENSAGVGTSAMLAAGL